MKWLNFARAVVAIILATAVSVALVAGAINAATPMLGVKVILGVGAIITATLAGQAIAPDWLGGGTEPDEGSREDYDRRADDSTGLQQDMGPVFERLDELEARYREQSGDETDDSNGKQPTGEEQHDSARE